MNEAEDKVVSYPVQYQITRQIILVVADLGGMWKGLFDGGAKKDSDLAESQVFGPGFGRRIEYETYLWGR